jgi:hypothetical protein
MALGTMAAMVEIPADVVEESEDSVPLVGAVVGANAGLLAALVICTASLSMAFKAVTWP